VTSPEASAFHWKYNTTTFDHGQPSFPFLNDDNEQDYLFSLYLVSYNPKTDSAWAFLTREMQQLVGMDNTTKPFQHVDEESLRLRAKKYEDVYTMARWSMDDVWEEEGPDSQAPWSAQIKKTIVNVIDMNQ
jgi:hypothetical protein